MHIYTYKLYEATCSLVHVNRYPRFYIPYESIPIRDSPHPTPSIQGRHNRGWWWIPDGYTSTLDTRYWISLSLSCSLSLSVSIYMYIYIYYTYMNMCIHVYIYVQKKRHLLDPVEHLLDPLEQLCAQDQSPESCGIQRLATGATDAFQKGSLAIHFKKGE